MISLSQVTTRLVVIRHGETEFNAEGRIQGHLDSPLTELGKSQAKSLAQRLGFSEIDALYSSDLGRAIETAQIVADKVKLTVQERPELRERAYGFFEGLTWNEAGERHPDALAAFRTGNPDFVIPGGEGLRELYERTVKVFTGLAENHSGQRIVVVTHGGVLACLFRFVLRHPLSEPRRFKLPNTAVNIFEVGDREWSIRTWGDTSHLGLL